MASNLIPSPSTSWKNFSYMRVLTTRDSKIVHVRTTPKAQNRMTPTPWKWSIKTHWCPVSSSAVFEVGPKVPLAQSSSASDKVRSFLSHENLPDSFLKSVAPVHHEEVLYLLQQEDRQYSQDENDQKTQPGGQLEQLKELLKSKGVCKKASSLLTLLHGLPPWFSRNKKSPRWLSLNIRCLGSPWAAERAGGEEGETDARGEALRIWGTTGQPFWKYLIFYSMLELQQLTKPFPLQDGCPLTAPLTLPTSRSRLVNRVQFMFGNQLKPTHPTDWRQRSWHSPGVKLLGAKRPPLCQTFSTKNKEEKKHFFGTKKIFINIPSSRGSLPSRWCQTACMSCAPPKQVGQTMILCWQSSRWTGKFRQIR